MERKLIVFAVGCIFISYIPTVTGVVNTPPIIEFNREWRLTETEEIGSVIDRISAFDVEGDHVTITLDRPSSTLFDDRTDFYQYFKLDDHNRVLLAKSLKGLVGHSYLVGIKSTDGTITSRADVKVTIGTTQRPKSHATSLANAFAPGPSSPTLIANIPNIPSFESGGPPLLNMDQGTVWSVKSTDQPGTVITHIDAHDISNTFMNLTVTPSDMVHISDKGEVTLAKSLTSDQIGLHHLKITATNQHSSISELVILEVQGDNLLILPAPIPGRTPPFKAADGQLFKPKVIIIEKDKHRRRPPKRSHGSNHKLIITLVMVLGVLPVVLVGMVLVYRYKRNQLHNRKTLSVKYHGKSDSLETPDLDRSDSNIISNILNAVGIHKRAQSNKYTDTRRSGSRTKSKISRSGSFEADEWEFPRHQLRFVGILGEGCFGQVWKCETLNGKWGDNFVAVKTLKECSGEEERKDLLQEIKVLKALKTHPNVVSFLGCCTDKEPLFMILEYLVVGKLQTYLRNSRTNCSYNNLHGPSGSLTPRDLTIFALQIAKGMDFLSKNFIIHRDLAARNVLVGEDKICKVADFGFARDVANNHVYERKSDGRLPIRWMATESLFDNVFTTKSDVWSFGILLWEIVTLGSVPYPGKSASEVLQCVKEGYRLEKPTHCHREIYNIMYYCWDTNASERPTFTELIQDLDALISKEVDYITLDNFPDHVYYSFNNTEEASGELL